MASDPIRDPSADDPTQVRFREGSDVATSLLPSIVKTGGPYADVFTQQITRYSVEGRTKLKAGRQLPMGFRSKALHTEGAAFRRLGNRTVFAAANGLDSGIISDLAQDVAGASDLCRPIAPKHTPARLPSDVGGEFGEFIREAADAILALIDGCRYVKVRVAAYEKCSSLATTLNHCSETTGRRTELHIEIETPEGRLRETRVDWNSCNASSFSPAELAWALRERAGRLEETVVGCPEVAAVLLPPGWGGTWMHEAVGHLLEADTALTESSALYDLRGSQVTTDSVTVVDDGTLQPSRVMRAFDDEGVPTSTTPLIESGIVVGLLTDRETAAQTGLPLTGNGRRSHFGVPPRPRMTNLLLRPGALTRDDMISSYDAVVLIDRMGHAWLDARDRMLYLEIDEASLVEPGRPARHLGRLVASSEPLDLLRNVVGVGNDFEVDLNRGYCLKHGAALPVTIGQPSVLIRSMQIRPAHSL